VSFPKKGEKRNKKRPKTEHPQVSFPVKGVVTERPHGEEGPQREGKKKKTGGRVTKEGRLVAALKLM